jgi:hypothetical protein
MLFVKGGRRQTIRENSAIPGIPYRQLVKKAHFALLKNEKSKSFGIKGTVTQTGVFWQFKGLVSTF